MAKHSRKKKTSAAPLVWSFVITLLLIAAVSLIYWFTHQPEPAEPEPAGTPNQMPTVDQRPVPDTPPASSAQSTPAPQPAPSSVPEQDADSSSSDAAPPASSAAPAGDTTPVQGIDALDGEQIVRGHIVYASTGSITIVTEDGTNLSFMRETADVTGRIVEDAEVEIHYVGSINGTDTSAAFVTQIVSFA